MTSGNEPSVLGARESLKVNRSTFPSETLFFVIDVVGIVIALVVVIFLFLLSLFFFHMYSLFHNQILPCQIPSFSYDRLLVTHSHLELLYIFETS